MIRVRPANLTPREHAVSIRRLVVLLAAGVLVGALAWSLTRLGGSDSAAPEPGSPARSLAGGPATTGAAPTATPGLEAGGSSPTGARTGGAAGLTHGGSEILPSPSSAASATAGLPGLPPVRSTRAPLVATPLPRPATSTGSLAAGYPAALAPPAGHTVAISSVAGSGDVLQASLTASCQRPCDPLRRYRVRLAARGFTEIAARSVENQPTAALRRGADSVTVTITARSATTLGYAVFAVLHTATA